MIDSQAAAAKTLADDHGVSLGQMLESAALVLGILVLVGIAYSYYWYSPAPPLPSLTATIRKSTLRVGGRDRSYLIYVPANLPPQAALVIVLHGSGMDGARIRLCTGYEFDCLADQHGFVVIYPDGYRRNWNDCRKDATFPAKRENIDDMGFIRTLIARASIEQAIDEQQVYAFGIPMAATWHSGWQWKRLTRSQPLGLWQPVYRRPMLRRAPSGGGRRGSC